MRYIFISIVICLCVGAIDEAHATEPGPLCVSEYETEKMKSADAEINAEDLIKEIAPKIGLATENISIFPCRFASKAFAWVAPPKIDNIIAGSEYIIYNTDWVREVIGKDRIQAIALFGHELGHILNRHYSRNLTDLVKETEADHFAGCAVALTGGDWKSLENLLSRLRKEIDAVYPDRLHSLESAKSGFDLCSKKTNISLVPERDSKPSTFCQFSNGWSDYAPLPPLNIGTSCQDGLGNVGRIISKASVSGNEIPVEKTTVCQFTFGWHDYKGYPPLPVNSVCTDGFGSVGVIVGNSNKHDPEIGPGVSSICQYVSGWRNIFPFKIPVGAACYHPNGMTGSIVIDGMQKGPPI